MPQCDNVSSSDKLKERAEKEHGSSGHDKLPAESHGSSAGRRRCAWYLREARALIILLLLVVVVVFVQRPFSENVRDFIEALKQIPLAPAITVIFSVQVVRKIVLPVYFVFPFGTIVAVFLAVRLSLFEAVVMYELVTLTQVVAFPFARIFYKNLVDRLCAGHFGKSDDWMDHVLTVITPRSLQAAIRALDIEWRECVQHASLAKRCLIAISWGTSEGMHEMAAVLWFACRSDVSFGTWTVGCILSMFCRAPRTLMALRILNGATEATSSGFAELSAAFKDMIWYEVLAILFFSGTSTMYVQFSNFMIMVRLIRKHTCKGDAPVAADACQPSDQIAECYKDQAPIVTDTKQSPD